jgi:hypothetical protein
MKTYSTLDDAVDDITHNIDSENYDIESLSWKLLTDDNLENFKQEIIAIVDCSTEDNDPVTFVFETLINIYMEIAVGYSKLVYLMELDENDVISLENFKLDINKIDFNTLDGFKEKFYKIGYIPYIHEAGESDRQLCYCTILLRDDPKNKTFFELIHADIPIDKKFRFIMNGNFLKQHTLKNVYAYFQVNKKAYVISFEKYIQSNT